MRIISQQIKSISKEIDIIQKNQIEIWELKSIIVGIKKKITVGVQQQISASRRKNQQI